MTTTSILDDAIKSNIAVQESLLGRALNNIWGKKLKKVSVDSETGSGYANLRKRIVDDGEKLQMLDVDNLRRIKRLCDGHEGWFVNHSPADNQVTLLKSNSPPGNVIKVNGRRLVCEITITLDPPQIVMRTHGKDVPIKDVFGEDLRASVSLHEIDTIIRFVEVSSLCIGHLEVSTTDENGRKSDLLHVPVSGSRVLDVAVNDCPKKMLVSTSRMLFATGTKACKSCMYSATLWNNRERERKAKDQPALPHSKCNLRFLARDGLKERINSQRKESRCDEKKI